MLPDTLKKLTVNEIFYSIQGESYLTGLPCVFVRLTGCHQRCTYCDTEYAFYEGEKMSLAAILEKVAAYPVKNVLITGGEPLLQTNTGLLARLLLTAGYRVAIETSGDLDIRRVPREVIKIMDLKTPGSGEMHRNNYDNISYLEKKDEVKFVVTGAEDVVWSLRVIHERHLTEVCHVSISPTERAFLPDLAGQVLEEGLPIRLQTQFHKDIWPGSTRGV